MSKHSEFYSWINETLSGLITQAQGNRLVDFDNLTIFDEPLIGIVDGDDPLFQTFKEVVSPNHLLPRSTLQLYADPKADLERITVISWALPFSAPIRRSNRICAWPSKLYSVARNNGGALNYSASLQLMKKFHEKDLIAVSPITTKEYDAFRSQDSTFSSTWSERHVAYAAGLGCFGLNGSLITRRGANVRLGSIITNLKLELKPPHRTNYRAPCLNHYGQECQACIKNCPVNAITVNGLDKEKCYGMRKAVRKRYLDTYAAEMTLIPSPIVKNGKRKNGYSLGCALCQCGVPCERSDPFREFERLL